MKPVLYLPGTNVQGPIGVSRTFYSIHLYHICRIPTRQRDSWYYTWLKHTTTFLRTSLLCTPFICSRNSSRLKIKLLIYTVFLHPIFINGALTRFCASITQIRRLNILQNRALWISFGAPWFVGDTQIYKKLAIPVVSEFALTLARKSLERPLGRGTQFNT